MVKCEKKLADSRMNTMQKAMEERLIWAVSWCAQLWDPRLQAYRDLNKISNTLEVRLTVVQMSDMYITSCIRAMATVCLNQQEKGARLEKNTSWSLSNLH